MKNNIIFVLKIFVGISIALLLSHCNKSSKSTASTTPEAAPPPPAPTPTPSFTESLNLVVPLPASITIDSEVLNQTDPTLLNLNSSVDQSLLSVGLTNNVQKHFEQHTFTGALIQMVDLNYEVKVTSIKRSRVGITKRVLSSQYQSPYMSGPFAETLPQTIRYDLSDLQMAMDSEDFNPIKNSQGIKLNFTTPTNTPAGAMQFQLQNCIPAVPSASNPNNADLQIHYYNGRYNSPLGGPEVPVVFVRKTQTTSMNCTTQVIDLNPQMPPASIPVAPTLTTSQIQIITEEQSVFTAKTKLIGNFEKSESPLLPQFQSRSVQIVGGSSLSKEYIIIDSPTQ